MTLRVGASGVERQADSTRASRIRLHSLCLGRACLAIPVSGTLKRVGGDHKIEETVSRAGLWEAQTPQVSRRQLLIDAYARRGNERATDDAQLVERLGQKVTIVPGSPTVAGLLVSGSITSRSPWDASKCRWPWEQGLPPNGMVSVMA